MTLLFVLAAVSTTTALYVLHTAINQYTEKGVVSNPMIVMWLLSATTAMLSWIKVLL